MWNYCKYCGKRIEDGVMCFGLPTGESVCVDCCVAKTDLLTRPQWCTGGSSERCAR